MFCARPSGEVITALSDELQREVRTEAVDLGDVTRAARGASMVLALRTEAKDVGRAAATNDK